MHLQFQLTLHRRQLLQFGRRGDDCLDRVAGGFLFCRVLLPAPTGCAQTGVEVGAVVLRATPDADRPAELPGPGTGLRGLLLRFVEVGHGVSLAGFNPLKQVDPGGLPACKGSREVGQRDDGWGSGADTTHQGS